MFDGVLLNGVISLAGGVGYLAIVPGQLRGARDRASGALALYLAAVGLHLSLAGARQIVAYGALTPAIASAVPLDLTALDLTLFLLASIVGASTVLPLAFYVCELRAPRLSTMIVGALAAYAAVGLTLFLVADKTGPLPSRWGSEWRVGSLLADVLLGIALAAPAIASITLLVRDRDEGRRKLGIAALVYYGAIIPDAVGLTGVVFVIARVAAASSCVLAYEATRRPFTIASAASRDRHTRAPR